MVGNRRVLAARTFQLTVRGMALVHLVVQLLVFLPNHWQRRDRYRDVTYLYTAAQRVRTGQPLYRPWPEYGPHVHTEMGPPYTYDRHPYPPPLASVLAPFSALPFTSFARLWYLPLLAGFWVYAWSLARMARGRTSGWNILIAGLLLGIFPGTYRALSLGQIDPILWALFGLALVLPAWRGAAFALSAAVKLYPGWPLLFAIGRERSRVFVPAAVVALGAVVVSGFVMGLDSFFSWGRHMLPVLSQGTFNTDNVSLSFAGLRIARGLGWEYVPGPLPVPARIYLALMGIAAPMTAGWLARKSRPAIQYAWVGAAAVLFAPLCWSSYLPLLLVLPALGLGVLIESRNARANAVRPDGTRLQFVP
jgi:hypothetical protein